jgi:hypothetical protein
MKILDFLLFLWVIFALLIRIRIQINADPYGSGSVRIRIRNPARMYLIPIRAFVMHPFQGKSNMLLDFSKFGIEIVLRLTLVFYNFIKKIGERIILFKLSLQQSQVQEPNS